MGRTDLNNSMFLLLMTEHNHNQEPEFVRLFTSTKPLEIEAAISLLEENDIPAYKIDKKDSSYIFGEIELYVDEENLDKAQLILTENNLL